MVLEQVDYLASIGMTRQSRNLVKDCFVSGLARMMFALRDGVQGEVDVLLNGPECSCTKGALVGDEARVVDPRLVRGVQDLSWQLRITPECRERDAVDGPRSPLRV